RLAGPTHPDAAALFESRLQRNRQSSRRRGTILGGQGNPVRYDDKTAQAVLPFGFSGVSGCVARRDRVSRSRLVEAIVVRASVPPAVSEIRIDRPPSELAVRNMASSVISSPMVIGRRPRKGGSSR